MTREGRRPMWEIRQQTDPAVLDLYIYGDVEAYEIDWDTYTIEDAETSANNLREELAAHPDVKTIRIYINSYGGDVFEGTAIYNQLRRHPAEKIAYIDGFACSIASVIAMAADRVIMPRNTLMMIHNMWMGAVGNAAELRKAADDLDIINAAGRQAYLTKAGDKLEEKKLIEMMDAETWLTAEQCIELGLADEYAEDDANMSAAGQILQQATRTLEQRAAQHRAVAAMLREMAAPAPEPQPEPEPQQELEPRPEPQGEGTTPGAAEIHTKTILQKLAEAAGKMEGKR